MPGTCPPCQCQQITIQGKQVILPNWLPKKGWSFCTSGYVIYSSRKAQPLITRGELLHRIIFRVLKGEKIPEGFHVHHVKGKLNNCPFNLIGMNAALHDITRGARCPYTGRYMRKDEWERMMR